MYKAAGERLGWIRVFSALRRRRCAWVRHENSCSAFYGWRPDHPGTCSGDIPPHPCAIALLARQIQIATQRCIFTVCMYLNCIIPTPNSSTVGSCENDVKDRDWFHETDFSKHRVNCKSTSTAFSIERVSTVLSNSATALSTVRSCGTFSARPLAVRPRVTRLLSRESL